MGALVERGGDRTFRLLVGETGIVDRPMDAAQRAGMLMREHGER